MKRKQVMALFLAMIMSANMTMPALAGTADLSVSAPTVSAFGSTYEDLKTAAAQSITADDLKAAMLAVTGTGDKGTETQGAEKEETVYVFTDATGKQKSMTVSNWLKNKDGASTLYDSSVLENIENVKGDEGFTRNGESLTWEANGNDIYYQGTTDKQPPILQKITYYLEGQEVTPEELAGKTGKVTIHIDYENTESYKDVYVPFTVMTGIIFSNDNVKNVEVDNGSVISEGKNTVVVGMAFPGMADSLQGVKDDAEHLLTETEASRKSKDKVRDLEIPDSVEITMDASEFKMSTCMTMVFSGLLEEDDEIDEDHDSILADMDEKIADLTKDGNDLADGAGELSDGIEEANEGTGELADGAGQLADGIKEYTDGVSEVNEGAGQLAEGTDTLADSLPELTGGLKDYTDGVSEVNKGAGKLKSGIKDYTDGVSEVNKGAGQLKSGTDTLVKSVPELTGGLKDYTDGVAGVDSGLGTLVESIPGLTDGASELSGGLEQAGEGADKLADGLGKLYAGTQELSGNS